MGIYALLVLNLALGWLVSRFIGTSRYGLPGDLAAGVARVPRRRLRRQAAAWGWRPGDT